MRTFTLYSLENLLDWKLQPTFLTYPIPLQSLYSLENLLDWKRQLSINLSNKPKSSLLAREPIRLETNLA